MLLYCFILMCHCIAVGSGGICSIKVKLPVSGVLSELILANLHLAVEYT